MGEARPEIVEELLAERQVARTRGDYATADGVRDRLRELGWQVEDHGASSTVRAILPTTDTELPDLLDQPASLATSLQAVVDEHPDDLARLVRGLARHAPSGASELVVVANAPAVDPVAMLQEVGPPLEAVMLRSAARLGWADARNLGLRRSRGEITVVLDTSLEPSGDFLTPLRAAFEDIRVGVAGGWGVVSGDGREFHEAPPGEVDAVEGYCLAIRRDALRAVGGFDPRYRFYRNADLDLCFAIRAAGWRAVRTEPLPLVRHDHRGWTAFPKAERDRLSRRNFYRFHRRWGHRPDLLLHPEGREERGSPTRRR